MYIHIPSSTRRSLSLIVMGAACVTGAFALGMHVRTNVTATVTTAADTALHGDMNGDGQLDALDAVLVLEIAQGYRAPTPDQRRADPDGDGHLTVDDAIRILRQVL